MGNQNDNYFYVSGLFSLFIFFFFFFFVVKFLFTPIKTKSFAMKRDTYVSISLEDLALPSQQKQKVEKEIAQVKKAKNIDINNLFSDVWTKKIVKKKESKKSQSKRRSLDLQRKMHVSKENDVKSLTQTMNDKKYTKHKNKKKERSTAKQVNEYLAKIQAIVYRYFHVPQNSQGSSVKIVIELNAFGKVLDFRVLNYSNNKALNREVDSMKERLMYVIFPENPQHISTKTIVILTSKE